MRGTRLAGDFGEYYTALCLLNSGGWREPDILDSNGIDLAAYPTDEDKPALGISVKTRNVANTENSSILLRKKDITYCFQEARARKLEPGSSRRIAARIGPRERGFGSTGVSA